MTIQELEIEYNRAVKKWQELAARGLADNEEGLRAEWQLDSAFMALCKAKGADLRVARKYIGGLKD